MVARFQKGGDDIGINHQQASADSLQDRLDAMGELGNGLQAHHARGTLQTVGCAECLVEVRTVGLTPLEIHQPFFQADQELARFLEEHVAKAVFRTAAQFQEPSRRIGINVVKRGEPIV
jgi:hypothetical protein